MLIHLNEEEKEYLRINGTQIKDGQTAKKSVSEKIYLGAYGVFDAIEQGTGVLTEMVKCENEEYDDEQDIEDCYEITSVEELEGVDVINWPGDTDECTCPACAAARCSPEDLMIFNCPHCEKEIKLADGNWISTTCPLCNGEITKDKLILIKDNRYYSVEKSKKEDNK